MQLNVAGQGQHRLHKGNGRSKFRKPAALFLRKPVRCFDGTLAAVVAASSAGSCCAALSVLSTADSTAGSKQKA
jgi:hypothetical protein